MFIDPRGIMRTVTKVEADAETFVTLDCGHRGRRASHFTYKVGSQLFCGKCGQQAKEKQRQSLNTEQR